MLISPPCLVNMYEKQKNFEVKMRQRGLINMQTKEELIGRHFGIKCMIYMNSSLGATRYMHTLIVQYFANVLM